MFKRLYEKIIVWGYVRYGMIHGDAVSYLCFDSFDEKRFEFFERRYIKLGYKKIQFAEFVYAGGYVGESHLKPFLYKNIKEQ